MQAAVEQEKAARGATDTKDSKITQALTHGFFLTVEQDGLIHLFLIDSIIISRQRRSRLRSRFGLQKREHPDVRKLRPFLPAVVVLRALRQLDRRPVARLGPITEWPRIPRMAATGKTATTTPRPLPGNWSTFSEP